MCIFNTTLVFIEPTLTRLTCILGLYDRSKTVTKLPIQGCSVVLGDDALRLETTYMSRTEVSVILVVFTVFLSSRDLAKKLSVTKQLPNAKSNYELETNYRVDKMHALNNGLNLRAKTPQNVALHARTFSRFL